jgi:hypothetical protein
MLKVLLAFLITIEILIIPLMILSLGTNILLPGVGLVISGEFIFVLLLIVEVITFILFRRLSRDSDRMA